MPAPTFGSRELFNAGAQPAKSQEQWGAVKLAADSVAQAGEEQQFAPLDGFIGELPEVSFDHTSLMFYCLLARAFRTPRRA